jgi:hypothetical protein
VMAETKYVVRTHAIKDNSTCLLGGSDAEPTFVLSLNKRIG